MLLAEDYNGNVRLISLLIIRDDILPVVKVSDLKIGQEFESDIKFNNGTILFKAAEKISNKHIKALKAWGFTEVGVIASQDAKQSRVSNASAAASDSVIKHVFSKANKEDPVIIELIRIAQNLKTSQ